MYDVMRKRFRVIIDKISRPEINEWRLQVPKV